MLSSPCALQKSHNQQRINHFHPKNSWHSSYAPVATIKVGGLSIVERAGKHSLPQTSTTRRHKHRIIRN
jgi:hypothetical protein